MLGFANAVRLDKESSDLEVAKTKKYMRKKLNRHNLLSDLSKISEGSDSQASTIISTQHSDQEMTETLKSSRINMDPLDLRWVTSLCLSLLNPIRVFKFNLIRVYNYR